MYTKEHLQHAEGKLRELTPLPMNTMLERETKAAAVQRKEERNKKVVEDMTPTTTGRRHNIQDQSRFSQLYFLIDQLFLVVLEETSILLYEKGKLYFSCYVPMKSNAGFAFVTNRNKMFMTLIFLLLFPNVEVTETRVCETLQVP